MAERERACGHHLGDQAWTCGESRDVRLYLTGARCPAHTPAALAGRPEPGRGRYCPPLIRWCGTCPQAIPNNVVEFPR